MPIFKTFRGFKCGVNRDIIENFGGDDYCRLERNHSECRRYILQQGKLEEERPSMITGSD